MCESHEKWHRRLEETEAQLREAADEIARLRAENAGLKMDVEELDAVYKVLNIPGTMSPSQEIERLKRIPGVELIEHLRLLTDNQCREIERLQAYANHERSLGAEGPMIELTQARQEIERLRALVSNLARENDQLKAELQEI